MGRGWDEAQVAPGVATAAVVGADREEPGELALAAGVGLQAHGVVAGAGDEHLFELVDQLAVALGLPGGSEGVDVGALGPGDGEHLGGGVELHGARAERDHRAVEGEVLVGQTPKVAEHLVLAVVAVEHRMRQHFVRAHKRRRQPDRRVGVDAWRRVDTERGEHVGHEGHVTALVEGDADVIGVDAAQVDARRAGGSQHRVGAARHPHGDGVEPGVVEHLHAAGPQAGRERRRQPVHAGGDPAQPLGPVPHGVHAGHHRQQDLGGADVARRLLPPDVLLARLQRQPQGRAAGDIGADAHQPAGQRAGVRVLARQEGGVGPAEPHRNTEPLRRADHQVGTERARRGEQHQGQRIGGDDGDATGGVHTLDHRRRIGHRARRPRVGQQHAVAGGGVEVGGRVADHDRDTDRLGPGPDHGDRLWMRVPVDEERTAGVLGQPTGHRHRFGRRRALVEHRGVGEVHAGEIGDHRLVVQQRLQAALADLGLVRRVGRVPGQAGFSSTLRAITGGVTVPV